MVDLARLRRAGQHDGVPAILERADELASAFEWPDLPDQLLVQLLLGGAKLIADLALDPIAAERRNELVAAHPDVPVNSPCRQHHFVAAEGPVPGKRMVIVRVDSVPSTSRIAPTALASPEADSISREVPRLQRR